MDVVFSNLINVVKHRYDAGDLIDRINYQFTPALLAIFALNLMAKGIVGQPLQCWVPAQFTGSWEKYAETHCFIENTYFLPWYENIPESYTHRKEKQIGYYQWVPYFLMLQAILFHLPCFIWKAINWKTGCNAKSLLENIGGTRKKVKISEKESVAEKAAVQFVDGMNSDMELGKHTGRFLTFVWLLVKFLYVLNGLIQLILMNGYLGMGTRYSMWGVGILIDVINGRTWEESGFFPRVTICDFQVRVMGNLNNWSVQCVLMINMFNEKIYIFVWWWVMILFIASLFSFIYWTLTLLIPGSRREFVERYLRATKCVGQKEGQTLKDSREDNNIATFINNQLKLDGVLILRLVQHAAGDFVTGNLIKQIWNKCIPENLRNSPLMPKSSLQEAMELSQS